MIEISAELIRPPRKKNDREPARSWDLSGRSNRSLWHRVSAAVAIDY
ncbi:hypothetical protein N9329_01715 [Gammaproteobacteria bacterium]|nr:hypothetical protein [Gammaproteobacteria bacterium]